MLVWIFAHLISIGIAMLFARLLIIAIPPERC